MSSSNSCFSFWSKKIAIPQQLVGHTVDANPYKHEVLVGCQKSSLKLYSPSASDEHGVVKGEANSTWTCEDIVGHQADVMSVSWGTDCFLSIDRSFQCYLWRHSNNIWSSMMISTSDPTLSSIKVKWNPQNTQFLLLKRSGIFAIFSNEGVFNMEHSSENTEWIDASWSTDGRTILLTTTTEVHVADTTGKISRRLPLSTAITTSSPIPSISSMIWSASKLPSLPNLVSTSKGNLAIVFNDGRIQVSSGLDTHNRDVFNTRMTEVTDLKWSADEDTLAVLGYTKVHGIDKYKILIYNAESKSIVNQIDIPGNIAYSLCWTFGDAYLAVTVDAFLCFVRIIRANLWTLCDNSLVFYSKHNNRPAVVFWNIDTSQQRVVLCRSLIKSIVSYNRVCAVQEGDSQTIALYNGLGESIRKVNLSPDSQFFGLSDQNIVCGSHHMLQVIPYSNPTLNSINSPLSSSASSAISSIDLIPIIEGQYSLNRDSLFDHSGASSARNSSPCLITAIAVSSRWTVVFCQQGYFVQFSTDEWYPQAVFSLAASFGLVVRASFNRNQQNLAVLSDIGEFDLLDLFHDAATTTSTSTAVASTGTSHSKGNHSASVHQHSANNTNANHSLGLKGKRMLLHRKGVWHFCWAKDDDNLIAIQEKDELLYIQAHTGAKVESHTCLNTMIDFHRLRCRIVALDKISFESPVIIQHGDISHIVDEIGYVTLRNVLQCLKRKEFPNAIAAAREHGHKSLYQEIAQVALQEARFDIAREIFANKLQDIEKVQFMDRIATLSHADAIVAVEAFVRSWVNAERGNTVATTFFDLIMEQDINGLKAFMTENPSFSVSQLDQSGKSALHISALRNLLEVVRWLCSLNIFVDQLDKAGNTAFALAASVGHLDIMRFLLQVDRRTDPNRRNKFGMTSLFLAVGAGQQEAIDFIIKEVPTSLTIHMNGESVLTYATRCGKIMVVSYLSQFLSLDGEDGNNKTPLFIAAEIDNLDMAKYLVEEKKVNIYHVNKNGITAQSLVQATNNRVYEYLTTLQMQGHDLENLQRSKEKVSALKKSQGIANGGVPSAMIMQSSIQDLVMNPEELRSILAQGKRAWGRSKIMLVGEGRAGKTALANSILGRSFTETDSTIGINQVTCDVQYTIVADNHRHLQQNHPYQNNTKKFSNLISEDGASHRNKDDIATSWVEYSPPEHELEAAVAKMVLDQTQNRRNSMKNTTNGSAAATRRNTSVGKHSTQLPEWMLAMMLAPTDGATICEDQTLGSASSPSASAAGASNNGLNTLRSPSVDTSDNSKLNRNLSHKLSAKSRSSMNVANSSSSTTASTPSLRSPSFDASAAAGTLSSSQSTTHIPSISPAHKATSVRPVINNLPRTASIDESEEIRSAAANVAIPEYDTTLVLECLADKINVESKFVISLFDFGGQSIFNVIHPFFLTKFGVYILAFNMEWLASDHEATEKERCLAYMRFWLNSIVVHTQNEEDGSVAPIAIVGTRKDIVHQPHVHEEISSLLYAEFGESAAWSQLIENTSAEGKNGKIDLFFFPVDNKIGRKDPSIKKLLTLLEMKIEEQPYIHAEQPLSWLQAYDKMKNSGKSFLHITEVESILEEANVLKSSTRYFLAFMHEMGMLMWHADDGLSDIVILDPVAYFVTPATILICKHEPNAQDHIHHSLEVHKRAKKHYKADWDIMVKRGVISQQLLSVLLSQYREHETHIVQLMVKYGLLLPMEQASTSDSNSNSNSNGYSNGNSNNTSKTEKDVWTKKNTTATQHKHTHASATSNNNSSQTGFVEYNYLAPSLLPEKSLMAAFKESVQMNHSEVMTFYFVFYASRQLEQLFTIPIEDCRRKGFLPTGFFERLICKAISWSQQTTGAEATQHMSAQYLYSFLSRSEAILYYGNQRFRMRLRSNENMIEVNVEGQSPVGVHSRLREQITSVIQECMKTLRFFTLLPLSLSAAAEEDDSNQHPAVPAGSTKSTISEKDSTATGRAHRLTLMVLETDTLLLPLSKVQLAMERKSVLSLHVYNRSLDTNALMQHFGGWLDAYKIYDAYDVFLSYRQGRHDTLLVNQLFDLLSLYTLAEEDHRAVAVFLDDKRLETGRSFQEEYAKALVRATVVVPVISADALKRMLHHDASREDNVLVEWILTLFALRMSSNSQAADSAAAAAAAAHANHSGHHEQQQQQQTNGAATSSVKAVSHLTSSKATPTNTATSNNTKKKHATTMDDGLHTAYDQQQDSSGGGGGDAAATTDRRKSRVRKVLPLFIGERHQQLTASNTATTTTATTPTGTSTNANTNNIVVSTTLGDLFAEGWIEQLPETIPIASIQLADRLFHRYVLTPTTSSTIHTEDEEHAINPASLADSFRYRTVKDIVRELTTTLGLKLSDYPAQMIGKKVALQVYQNVQECVLLRLQHLRQQHKKQNQHHHVATNNTNNNSSNNSNQNVRQHRDTSDDDGTHHDTHSNSNSNSNSHHHHVHRRSVVAIDYVGSSKTGFSMQNSFTINEQNTTTAYDDNDNNSDLDDGNHHSTNKNRTDSNTNPPAAHTSSTKPLSTLSVDDVHALFSAINMTPYLSMVQDNGIDGLLLSQCNEDEELRELGISKSLHVKKLRHFIEAWKLEGVPRAYLRQQPHAVLAANTAVDNGTDDVSESN